MFVSDRALCFFESDHFVEIVKIYRAETYPVMVPVIERLSKDHWQKLLIESFKALKQILLDLDNEAYKKALAEH